MATVYRWRAAFQADFQARLDWCVKPYAEANHPPSARVAGEVRRTVAPGENVLLDASPSSDPDGHSLAYEWYFYGEPGSYAGSLSIQNSTSTIASFVAPRVSSRQTIHIILTVQDNGSPPLSSYQRIVITVDPFTWSP